MKENQTCISDTHCHLSLLDSATVAKTIEHFLSYEHAFLLDVAIHGYPELPEKPYSFLYHSAGLHPGHLANVDHLKILQSIEEGIKIHPEAICAIGETGLDAYKYAESYAQQCESFEAHVALAEKLNLPIIIHNRNADDDVIKIHGGKCPGVLHCFSNTLDLAYKALDAGLCLSFAGNLSYPRNDELRELLPKIPHESILVETDSPYLAPQALRGSKNEPINVSHTAKVIAHCLDMDIKSCEHLLYENAMRLFRVKNERHS